MYLLGLLLIELPLLGQGYLLERSPPLAARVVICRRCCLGSFRDFGSTTLTALLVALGGLLCLDALLHLGPLDVADELLVLFGGL